MDGDQRIWRLAAFSSNLDVGFVARFLGVRRRAPAKTTATPNKVSLDPPHASLSLASPAADPEMVCSDLAGMATVPSRSKPFLPRIRRRRDRAPLRLCSLIRGLLQEFRRRRWSFHRRCSRATVSWCKVCGSWWRIRRDFIDFVVWSTGFGPTEHGFRPGRRATALAPRWSQGGSSSTHKAISGDGATSV